MEFNKNQKEYPELEKQMIVKGKPIGQYFDSEIIGNVIREYHLTRCVEIIDVQSKWDKPRIGDRVLIRKNESTILTD